MANASVVSSSRSSSNSSRWVFEWYFTSPLVSLGGGVLDWGSEAVATGAFILQRLGLDSTEPCTDKVAVGLVNLDSGPGDGSCALWAMGALFDRKSGPMATALLEGVRKSVVSIKQRLQNSFVQGAGELRSTHFLVPNIYYSPLTTLYLLLTTHYSLLHYSLLTTHYSLLTTHHSLLTTHYLLLTTYYSLQITYSSYCLISHYSLRTTYYVLLPTYQLLPTGFLQARQLSMENAEKELERHAVVAEGEFFQCK